MKRNNKGFVVSAVLYPLLVLFLALIMGLLAMTDTRKRILDKMKLEISDSIFDEATCSCDTILNKLNYLIKNGVGGGGGGSYTYNVLGLNVKGYETPNELPNVGNGIGDIAVITDTEISNYYVSNKPPKEPKNGTVWIVQDKTSNYYVTSDYSKIGISYAMQYICDDENGTCEWQIKKSYVYDDGKWSLLYYIPIKDGIIDLTSTDVNGEIVKTYSYTGEYQTFTARFSGYYQIELWGAMGGNGYRNGAVASNTSATDRGGYGSYTKGKIYLESGTTLYVYVGGRGTDGALNVRSGGWNGGGTGDWDHADEDGAGAGGGATDIRLVPTSSATIWNEFDSLKSRIMVAAGGGGGIGSGSATIGDGGGIRGYNSLYGKGAHQIMGYAFGYGEDGVYKYTNEDVAGGGSGYFGGSSPSKGANVYGTSGAGGSSYISGHNGCISIKEDSTVELIRFNDDSYHYSGFSFIDTEMIDGRGYQWKYNIASKTGMPTFDGTSTMTGNTSNGYAKITLLNLDIITEEEYKEVKQNSLDESPSYFSYMEYYQPYVVPYTGYYQIELWGAMGGNAMNNGSVVSDTAKGHGGYGSYTKGKIYLKAGTKLYIYVGGRGTNGALNVRAGGWNGGGTGDWDHADDEGSGSGGGATDIRLVPTSSATIWNEVESLESRIMVAAGGGGGGAINGGAGGGLFASNLGSSIGGGQINGYAFGYGQDGVYQYSNSPTAGAGGGYYGGSSPAINSTTSSGAGGSSYISGHDGCVSINKYESSESQWLVTNESIHESNLYFTNTQMIDGDGYTWTYTKTTETVSMPTFDGTSTMTGNTSDGYAKISLLEKIVISEEEYEADKEKNFYYTKTFRYTGRYARYIVKKAGYYQIELWGAMGGNAMNNGSVVSNTAAGHGGYGAYTSGQIYLTKGTKLYFYVGGRGADGALNVRSGGWNGGGTGDWDHTDDEAAGAGGGATDVRTVSTNGEIVWKDIKSLASRIMVAAGGGGGGSNKNGGSGGGLVGDSSNSGSGGGQTSGYTFGFGEDGVYKYSNAPTAGAGGGWYGGNSPAINSTTSSGAGGSSYISGHEGCIGVNSDAVPLATEYTTLADSISYTNYKFINTYMIDGNAYQWTNEKYNTATGMPTLSGTDTTTGNTGDGYARITYLGA